MKKFVINYLKFMKKDKLFLVWNVSFVSLFWTGYFLSLSNVTTVACWGYALACNVGCLIVFMGNIKGEFDKKEKQYQEEKELLDFWLNECERLFGEYKKASEGGFAKEQETADLSKQYENAVQRYLSELKRLAEKHGLKVEIKKMKIGGGNSDGSYNDGYGN